MSGVGAPRRPANRSLALVGTGFGDRSRKEPPVAYPIRSVRPADWETRTILLT